MHVSFADPTNVKFVRHFISTSPPSFKVAYVMIPLFIESTTGQEAIIIMTGKKSTHSTASQLILCFELSTGFILQLNVPMQLNSLLNHTVWLHAMIGDPLR